MKRFSAGFQLFLLTIVAVFLLATGRLNAQELNLEGQTGGFITPTAYVVYSAPGTVFSHPAIGYHFVDANAVIGDVHTFNITEGFANRAEIGYTRNVHFTGNSPLFSSLWDFNGMNIFHGKVVAVKENQFGDWTPGLAVGGIIRSQDRFLSGALNQALTGTLKNYTNGDVYAAVTKTWLKPPFPFLANFGLKFTNASIFGIGGQSTRFMGRVFGGLGFPLPLPHKLAIIPAVGFTQQPPQIVNVGAFLIGGKAHIPTTIDYAIRITQKENPHFALDIGGGHVVGVIGDTVLVTPLGPQIVPVDLQANAVFGLGLSFRY